MCLGRIYRIGTRTWNGNKILVHLKRCIFGGLWHCTEEEEAEEEIVRYLCVMERQLKSALQN